MDVSPTESPVASDQTTVPETEKESEQDYLDRSDLIDEQYGYERE